MVSIKIFEFNPIQVNTYVLFDETQKCVIIDPGCYGREEEKVLKDFISENNLIPELLINTHAHTDHILGNHFVIKEYNVGLAMHKDSDYFMGKPKEWAEMLGFEMKQIDMPNRYLNEGDIINFGDSELKVIFTPGHADGSICLLNSQQKFVITGDVLFSGSIGRTDLPTGDFRKIERSIKDKLYTLDDSVVVYPGHGPSTTIGHEKQFNPFINGN